MSDTQPRWFAGRKVTACRECPYMRSDTSWHYCGALHAPNETGVCPASGVRSDCPLPIYEPETIVGVSPARLRQLERREAALKALAKSANGNWGTVSVEDGDFGTVKICHVCGGDERSDGTVWHYSGCALAAAIAAAQEEDEA